MRALGHPPSLPLRMYDLRLPASGGLLVPLEPRSHLAFGTTARHTAAVSASAGSTREILEAIDQKSREIAGSLRALDDNELHQGSELPEWSRLTIACHLRFGAEALIRLTRSATQGVPAAYYPEGRARQRPRTLVPNLGESPQDVVESLARVGDELIGLWSSLGPTDWDRPVVEPPENPDLGPTPPPRPFASQADRGRGTRS